MKNILLIENDSATISKVVNALNFEEYSIDIAENSSSAKDLALKNLPELVICNINILESDWENILIKLREESFISSVPFIYILEKSRPKAEQSNLKKDLDFFIIKPFKSEEIKRLALLAIEKHQKVKDSTEKKLSELRGSISFALPHEFFTPLNGIIGFSEILMKEYENLETDEIQQMLKYINKDALRLKKITENILLFAQIEMIALTPEKLTALRNSYFINPSDIISMTSKLIAEEYERENDLVLELEDSVIRMSEGYIKKIITELVDNAFKFSEKGSQVIISMMSNSTSVLISINDSGRGMTPEQITSIGAYMQFERKVYDQQGSGLGLIIAKKIAEIHAGSFKIESVVNEGTKINMIFDN